MCKCKPGSYENGWHEHRSPECVREEMRAVSRAIKSITKKFPRYLQFKEKYK